MIKNINLFIADSSEKKPVEPLMFRSKTQANIKTNNNEEQVFKNNKLEEQDNEIEIKPMPFDISKIEIRTYRQYVITKKCHICCSKIWNYSTETDFFYLWGNYHCKSCWEFLACKSCDNQINKSEVYKGTNNEVFCEVCISKNKKRVSYKTKNKINILIINKMTAFNITDIRLSTELYKNCRICRNEYVNYDLYYELWTHYYCGFCWSFLACKGCDNFLNKNKAYRGKNYDVYCEECIWYNWKASLPSKTCKIVTCS